MQHQRDVHLLNSRALTAAVYKQFGSVMEGRTVQMDLMKQTVVRTNLIHYDNNNVAFAFSLFSGLQVSSTGLL